LSDATVYALVTTAALTALIHTLIPDHWLPFVLIGRAQGWTTATVVGVSGLSAMIHTVLSVALALLALAVGMTAAEAIGETLERAGGWLLIVFGVAYAVWAWRKGGHFHPGGALLHADDAQSCNGAEGDGNPDHLHYHADDELIRGRRWGTLGLAVIVGVNPCVLIMPVLLSSTAQGATVVALVTAAYVVPTVALMIGLSVLGVRAGWWARLPGAARHMEMASGLLIAALGGFFALFGH